jgi:hypothetical protein
MAVALRTRAEVEHEAERVTCISEDHAVCHAEIDVLLGEWERLG